MSPEDKVRLVRKWADINTDAVLEAKTEAFSIPSIEGLIGYRVESKNAVVYGDPVCDPSKKHALAKAFQDFCHEQKLGIVYTIVSEPFALWGVKELEGSCIEFGKRLILDPAQHPFNQTGAKASLARQKMRHALKEGAEVFEYTGGDAELEKEMNNTVSDWKKTRYGIQVHFSDFYLFENRFGKRWFYAKHKGKVVGILMLNRLQAHEGWLLNHIITTKKAPHGTSELLMISTLQILEKENCRLVLAGPIPSSRLGKMEGLPPSLKIVAQWLFKGAQFLLKLNRHQAFWEKFQPKEEGSYLLFPKKNFNYASVVSILKAYNTGFN